MGKCQAATEIREIQEAPNTTHQNIHREREVEAEVQARGETEDEGVPPLQIVENTNLADTSTVPGTEVGQDHQVIERLTLANIIMTNTGVDQSLSQVPSHSQKLL
jgi:hypothetical protein